MTVTEMEKEYVERYKPKYFLGDRVRGTYEGVPFVGTVGIDIQLNEEDGPYVMVMVDLPISVSGKISEIIRVKHEDIDYLK